MVRTMEQLRLHTIIPQFGLYDTFFFVSPLDMCLVLMQWHLVSWAALESPNGQEWTYSPLHLGPLAAQRPGWRRFKGAMIARRGYAVGCAAFL